MGPLIVITLLIFYALGTLVFHTQAVRVLPLVALIVFFVDRLLILRYGSRDASTQG